MWLIKIPVKDTPVMPQGLDPSGLKTWALRDLYTYNCIVNNGM